MRQVGNEDVLAGSVLAVDLFDRSWRGTGEVPLQARPTDSSEDLCLPHCVVQLAQLLGDRDPHQRVDNGEGGSHVSGWCLVCGSSDTM